MNITLSDRFKHAFKVALAMVITYGIALSMGWEKPFWAGLDQPPMTTPPVK